MTELGLETRAHPRDSFNFILSLKKEEEEEGTEKEEKKKSEKMLQKHSTMCT